MPLKPRVLVFIVAYNAEKTIEKVLFRIPGSLLETYEVDVLIIDDSSPDATFEKGLIASRDIGLPFRVTVLYNPVNQGYGGNQKIGYRYAIEHGYDFVALIHGDGQYAPECLPELLEPLRRRDADAVFGSRMMNPKDALRGGMPLYKFVGNKCLTWMENRLLKSHLSEFHSGYRVYSTRALAAIPFARNSNAFHFDTEIIIQLLRAGLRIKELPIPTHYGNEVCHVNSLKYGSDVIIAAAKARLQNAGIFYDRKFDCAPEDHTSDKPRLNYDTPHALALERIRPHSRVLYLGSAGGHMAEILATQKHCSVDGIDDRVPVEPGLHEFHLYDLNTGLPNDLDYGKYDYVLMLDVIEHLAKPEAFLDSLRAALRSNSSVEIIMGTANVGFMITRLMLLIGQFNYGRRGILDLTHTRLFTFRSFERAAEQSGFEILERKGIPGPYPMALGDNFFSRTLLAINKILIHLSRGLFSYQILLHIRPLPSLELLLETAQEYSRKRVEALERSEF